MVDDGGYGYEWEVLVAALVEKEDGSPVTGCGRRARSFWTPLLAFPDSWWSVGCRRRYLLEVCG